MGKRRGTSWMTEQQPAISWVPHPKDIIIPIMGPTSAGKSTLINTAAQKNLTAVGHGLDSCTTDVVPIPVPYPRDPGRRVVFVDTPGFDDTFQTDTIILERIAAWMERTYRNKNNLAGIIYLHDISQARMRGTTHRNFVVFSRLCGIDAVKNIVLATTKWSQVAGEMGRKREGQLIDVYWNELLKQGSKLARFRGSYDSVWDVVDHVVEGISLHHIQIQKELVILQKRLPETDAGKALRGELKELLQKQQELARSLRATSNMTPELKSQYEETVNRIRSLFTQLEKLKIPLGRFPLLWIRSLLSKGAKVVIRTSKGNQHPEGNDCMSKPLSDDWVGELNDIIILVMGPTGVGKSTFINIAAGKAVTPIGDNLEASMTGLVPIPVPYPADPNRRVVFVEAPGFGDELEDVEISKCIAGWIQRCYSVGNGLAGVIYLHDISQSRWGGPMRQSFGSFSNLFGVNAAEHVVLATTKWDQVSPDDGQHRERQLSTEHCKQLLHNGSVLFPFGGSDASVWDIVGHVVEHMPLRYNLIQREIAKYLPNYCRKYAEPAEPIET